MANNVTIRQGSFTRDGSWDVGRIEDADVTIYLQPDHYDCIVPLERKLLISISRFYVLFRASTSSQWQDDHIIWTWSF